MRLKDVLGIMLSAGIANIGAANYTPENVSVSLKVPGNDAKHYSLTLRKVQDGVYDCQPSESLPLVITRQVTEKDGNNASMLSSKPWRMCISIMESR